MGVSADPVDRQKQFDEENELGFPLLSDGDKSVAGVFGVKRFGPMPTKRATFVVGQDKKLLAAITSETNMNKHADDALAVVSKI